MTNLRMQAVLSLMNVKDAYKELAEWWKEVKERPKDDELNYYPRKHY